MSEGTRVTRPYSGTNPNRTHETAKTVLDLYSDKGIFPFLLRGAHKKNSLKIDALPFSNRTRNRTRTAADSSLCRLRRQRTKQFLWVALALSDHQLPHHRCRSEHTLEEVRPEPCSLRIVLPKILPFEDRQCRSPPQCESATT